MHVIVDVWEVRHRLEENDEDLDFRHDRLLDGGDDGGVVEALKRRVFDVEDGEQVQQARRLQRRESRADGGEERVEVDDLWEIRQDLAEDLEEPVELGRLEARERGTNGVEDEIEPQRRERRHAVEDLEDQPQIGQVRQVGELDLEGGDESLEEAVHAP